MNLYPIFVKIEDKIVAVIGGGDVAARKVKDLLKTGAFVRVVAPDINDEIKDLVKNFGDKLALIQREYNEGDLDGVSLVFTTTDDPYLNNEIFKEATEKGLLVNSADDPDNCSFYVPSHVRKGDFILAVSTGGSSPAMAALLRRTLEKDIPDNIEEILNALKEARKILFGFDNLSSSDRGIILKSIVNDNGLLGKLVERFNSGELKEFLRKIKIGNR